MAINQNNNLPDGDDWIKDSKFVPATFQGKTALIGDHPIPGLNEHKEIFDFDKQQRTRLMERQALAAPGGKKYFWHIAVNDDKTLYAAIVINLPQMTGKQEGDYDEEQIAELNKIFHREFDGYKIKKRDTVLTLEQKVKSQL